MGLNLSLVQFVTKHQTERTILSDMAKLFIPTKNNLPAHIVHTHATLKNIYTDISKTVIMKLLNLYNFLNIRIFYFPSSGSNLGLSLMLVPLVIKKATTEITLSNMFEFILEKNPLLANIVNIKAHVNQI